MVIEIGQLSPSVRNSFDVVSKAKPWECMPKIENIMRRYVKVFCPYQIYANDFGTFKHFLEKHTFLASNFDKYVLLIGA